MFYLSVKRSPEKWVCLQLGNHNQNIFLSFSLECCPVSNKYWKKVLETSSSKDFLLLTKLSRFLNLKKSSKQNISLTKLSTWETHFLPFSEQFVMETSCSCLLIDTFFISRVFFSFFEYILSGRTYIQNKINLVETLIWFC